MSSEELLRGAAEAREYSVVLEHEQRWCPRERGAYIIRAACDQIERLVVERDKQQERVDWLELKLSSRLYMLNRELVAVARHSGDYREVRDERDNLLAELEELRNAKKT